MVDGLGLYDTEAALILLFMGTDIIAFLLLQRWISEGLTSGAVK